MKKQFPIGVWFDGRVEGINCDAGFHNVPKDMQAAREYYERNFQDVHDHNIDIIVIPNTPPDYRETLLSVADKVGLKVVLEIVELAYVDFGGRHSVRSPDMIQDEAETIKYCQDLVAPLRTHASLMCYQVLDEPSAEQFGNFALISRVLEHVDPDHPSFSCLCNEGELDRTITMGTQMVIFDRYPLHRPSKPGEYDFSLFRGLLNTLDLHRKNLPYWMVIQTFAMDRPTGGCRYPSPEEIRAMTWLSLAHNSKGIFWFLHNSYTQGEKLQGLVDLELKPHPIYAEVSDLSKMLKKLSPILLGLSREKTPAATPQSGFAVESFTDDQGGHYLCVVNTDVLKPATFKGVLKPQTPAAEDTAPKDVLSGEQIPVTSSKDGLSLSIELPAGGGRLFKY